MIDLECDIMERFIFMKFLEMIETCQKDTYVNCEEDNKKPLTSSKIKGFCSRSNRI